MKKCSSCEQIKSFIEFNRMKSSKDGYKIACKKCRNHKYVKYAQTRLGKLKNKLRMRRHRTTEKYIEYCEKYNESENRKKSLEKYNKTEKRKKVNKRYSEKHKEKIKIYNKIRSSSEHGKKLNKCRTAKRRALKKHATVNGYEEEIKNIYKNCPVGYEVDHIVPLQSNDVCGLHVPWNLQYLTPIENKHKSNKLLI